MWCVAPRGPKSYVITFKQSNESPQPLTTKIEHSNNREATLWYG